MGDYLRADINLRLVQNYYYNFFSRKQNSQSDSFFQMCH